MWTTSSSRGERRTESLASAAVAWSVALLFAAAACGCQSGSRQPRVGPESPAPALTVAGPKPSGGTEREQPRPPDRVNVRSARIFPARDVAADLAPAHVVKAARDPLLVEVTLDAPALEDRSAAAAAEPADSMLVIVLNGERLLETRLVPGRPPRLRAFLPDRTLLRDTNDVTVAWLGREHLTRDVKGLALPLAEIPK